MLHNPLYVYLCGPKDATLITLHTTFLFFFFQVTTEMQTCTNDLAIILPQRPFADTTVGSKLQQDFKMAALTTELPLTPFTINSDGV